MTELEVSHTMSWKEKICPDGFLNQKKRKRMLEEKEKKFHSASGLGAFLTRWLAECEKMKRSVGKGMHLTY